MDDDRKNPKQKLGKRKKRSVKLAERKDERKVNLENKSGERVYKKVRIPKDDKSYLESRGVGAKRYSQIRFSNKAKRAQRTLGRIDKRDKRRAKRKLK